MTERRLAGEKPLKIWRTSRGLSHEGPAKRVRVSPPEIAPIEAGHEGGGRIRTLKRLAAALKVELDFLV